MGLIIGLSVLGLILFSGVLLPILMILLLALVAIFGAIPAGIFFYMRGRTPNTIAPNQTQTKKTTRVRDREMQLNNSEDTSKVN